MKTILTLVVAVCVVTPALGQGTVQFSTRLTAGSPPYYSQVFHFEPNDPYAQHTGNTAANIPAGTQVYGGAPVTGNGYSAQLFAIPGSTIPGGPYTSYGVPVNDTFIPATPTTTFRSGASAGSVAGVIATLQGIAPDAASAVLQIRVFPTFLGTWSAAVAYYQGGGAGFDFGASLPFVVNNIGGGVNNPPQLTGVSFSLITGPEPSSLSLFGLGLAWFVGVSREKSSGPAR